MPRHILSSVCPVHVCDLSSLLFKGLVASSFQQSLFLDFIFVEADFGSLYFPNFLVVWGLTLWLVPHQQACGGGHSTFFASLRKHLPTNRLLISDIECDATALLHLLVNWVSCIFYPLSHTSGEREEL